MPRFFFDVRDGHHERDDKGTFCDDVLAAALEAKLLLPEIARHEVPKDGERQIFTVLVTDEEGRPVYSAALCFVGTWLLR
jgi:protocatechuate 3,4-dioxygenase beta subunit